MQQARQGALTRVVHEDVQRLPATVEVLRKVVDRPARKTSATLYFAFAPRLCAQRPPAAWPAGPARANPQP